MSAEVPVRNEDSADSGPETSRSSLMFSAMSEGLRRLQAEPLRKQADFWMQLAEDLEPQGLQPHSIEVSFDVLARYYDGTILGISSITQQAVGKKEELTFQDLATVVATRFGFLSTTGEQAAQEHAGFRRLCDVICHGSGEVEGRTATLESVIYAVRRLRLGALLADNAVEEGRVYCYDYSDDAISDHFVPSTTTRLRFGLGGWHTVSTVEKQKTAGDGSLAEYFFSDPSTWPGRVHWVHAHEPGLLMLLALGQQHRLRSHIQGVSCRLRGALPQLDVTQPSEELDKQGSKFWSSAVFPFFHLDQAATDSLQDYKEWFYQRSKEAKTGRLSTVRSTTLPPVVNVGVVHRNLAILWTGLKDSTVISIATEALYLGKWDSSAPEHTKTVESFLARCFCGRRWKGKKERRDGYQPLSQDDWDVEAADMESEIMEGDNEVQRRLEALKYSALAEHNASFEQSFSDLLVQLGETHSPLRMGTHVQLVFRLMLHGTSHCLDVIALYEAALIRIKCLLSDPQQPQKDVLMTKVHLAKLELTNMLRMVEPFTEYVMPRLRSDVLPQSRGRGNEDALSSRIALHNMVDIENNLHHFLRECRSQIEVCESLMSEYHMAASAKVNSILNFLTVITFLVMPIQLLTGLYGMNFRGMPELHWEYGYVFFFCVASASTALIGLFLVCIYRGMV